MRLLTTIPCVLGLLAAACSSPAPVAPTQVPPPAPSATRRLRQEFADSGRPGRHPETAVGLRSLSAVRKPPVVISVQPQHLRGLLQQAGVDQSWLPGWTQDVG